MTKAIDDRGLSGATLRQGDFACSYLLAAYYRIVSNLSPFLFIASEPSLDACPLCHVQKQNDEHKKTCTDPQCVSVDFETWIVKAADGALDEAKSRGLVGIA